ncbi:MAG: hypothetical protein ACTSPQ_20820 [Candidatus Helarchaeota archaeon]
MNHKKPETWSLNEWKKFLSSLKEENIKGLSSFTQHGWRRSMEREDRTAGKETILYCFSQAKTRLLRVKKSHEKRFELYFKPINKHEILTVVGSITKKGLYVITVMDNNPKHQKRVDNQLMIYKKRTGKLKKRN